MHGRQASMPAGGSTRDVSVPAAVAGIDALLDAALAGVGEVPADPGAIEALGDIAIAVGRLAVRLAALDAALIGRFDASAGWKPHTGSCQAWVRQASGWSGSAALARARLARRAAAHPILAERLAAGRVEPGHLRVLAEAHAAARHLRDELDAAEPVIADYAERVPPEELAVFLRELIITRDPDAEDRKAERDLRERARLDVLELPDGWVKVAGMLPPELGARLLAALTSLRRAPSKPLAGAEDAPHGPPAEADAGGTADADPGSAAQADGTTPGDPPLRPAWVRNLDALAALLDHAEGGRRDGQPLPRLRGSRPVVHVTIDLADFLAARGFLASGGDGPGRLSGPAGRGPVLITSEAARRIACDAVVRRMLLDPQGLPIDLGRATRTVTPAQDVTVRQRDRHCRWPGCRDPIDEIHHIHHWAAGGRSDVCNYCGYCWTHHVLAHHPDWRVEGDGNGVITFTYLPTGRRFVSVPPTPPRPPKRRPGLRR